MTNDTGGASLLWTSDDPAVVAARNDVSAGRLADAESRLQARPASSASREGLQVIGWIRRDYALTDAQMLATLRGSIPDVTAADIARWREQGVLQHRAIDGEPRIFRSEPANLFRFCGEARQRRVDTPPPPDWRLEDHLERVIGAVAAHSEPIAVPVRHEVDYELTVPPDAPGLRPGAVVRAWLPYPQTFQQQRDVRLIESSPPAVFVAPERRPHRSLYFEHRVQSPADPVRFTATFQFTTSAWCPLLAGTSDADPHAAEHLGERPPHIVFTPSLRSAVARAVGDAQSALERASRIFHWVCQNIAYNAEEEYGIIPSLSARALHTGRGDCGVQAMLLIAMCRCAGIPARWQSGWQTQPVRWNMHDWCEIHIDTFGWVPVDPSYGLRESDDLRVREFYFGGIDAYRMIVNTDYGRTLCPPKASLRSEPLDFQRGEVEVDGQNLYLDQWQSKFRPRWVEN